MGPGKLAAAALRQARRARPGRFVTSDVAAAIGATAHHGWPTCSWSPA